MKQEQIILADNLKRYVQEYSGTLTPEIIDYLNSLINLEISALNQETISDGEMVKLYELSLYRKIVIYNIYNRILNVFEKCNNNFNIEICSQGLNIYVKDRTKNKYDVLNYWPNEYGLSTIVLQQTIIDSAKRQEQIDKLYNELVAVKTSKEPNDDIIRRGLLCAGKETKIRYINDLIKKLDSHFLPDDNIKYITQEQEYFVNQMLGKNGLQITQNFEENKISDQSDISMYSITLNTYSKVIEREMTKKLVKTYPHTKISKTIKYY